MRRALFYVIALVILLSAANISFAAENGLISPGDTLRVTVLGEQDLSRQVIVDDAGKISMPLIGEVAVSGLSPTDAADVLRKQLAKFIKRPQVSVEVTATAQKSVIVTGAVKTPGAYNLQSNARLMDAIASAGGVLPSGNMAKVNLTRGSDKTTATYDLTAYQQNADSALNPTLEAGDIINVPETIPVLGEVYITGEVAQKGAMQLREGMTLRDAIAAAGGLTLNADPAGATIKRAGAPTAVPVDVVKAMAGDPNADMELKTGDLVYIPTIQQLGNFSVFGEVNHPGTFPLRGKVMLTDAIAQAGGMTQRAKASARLVNATGSPTSIDVQKIINGQSQNVEVKAGDTIVVDRKKAPIDPFRAIGAGVSIIWAIIRAGGN